MIDSMVPARVVDSLASALRVRCSTLSYAGGKIGGEDGIRTRKDRDDLGITRRLAAGLKCASLLDLPWLFRCFCKDPSSDLARPGFTRAGFPTFPGELAELTQPPL
jgi:hypothetical protein